MLYMSTFLVFDFSNFKIFNNKFVIVYLIMKRKKIFVLRCVEIRVFYIFNENVLFLFLGTS